MSASSGASMGNVGYSNGMQWEFQSQSVPKDHEDLVSLLLENRDIHDFETFLNPPHPQHLPLDEIGIIATQLDEALKRIEQAVKQQETVVVYGDYDVDGVCATAIMWESLRAKGLTAHPFIPDRKKHGYGLSKKALDEIIEQYTPSLVITVDTGIVAESEVAYLNTKGIDCIITDHHSPGQTLPAASAIVHTTKLCGTTVAWWISAALDKEVAQKQLDLCGLATIADQVPLLEANRSFAYHGLKAIQTSQRQGIMALSSASGVVQSEISEETVGFLLAPRINALARMDHALDALRLLCTGNKSAASNYADTLTQKNDERKTITHEQYNQARTMARTQLDQSIIIVSSTEFHDGIIGLLAGRLVEEFSKPAVVIAVSETLAKGSARSISGVNITTLLRKQESHLLSVGGHPMAAGFSLHPDKITLFRSRLIKSAHMKIDPELLQPALTIDCELPADLLTLSVLQPLDSLRPYGSGNPSPVFCLKDYTVLKIQDLGKAQKHCKLFVTKRSQSEPIEILIWNAFRRKLVPNPGETLDLAVTLSKNVWKGNESLQITLLDFHKH